MLGFKRMSSLLAVSAGALGLCIGCAGDPARQGTPAQQAAVGAAIGAVAGNALGYLIDADRKTTTVLGGLIGAGIGYWRGLEADKALQSGQGAVNEIVRLQQSQSRYRYESPRLYAHEVAQTGAKGATFERLEAGFPYEALRDRSDESREILRRLGVLAAQTSSEVIISGPQDVRDYMATELTTGAAGTLRIIRLMNRETEVTVRPLRRT
jgi:hypothetical protein